MASTVSKQWTFMVYLAGDNTLADAGPIDLKEMKKVGSTDDINIVAQFDNGLNGTTRRYLLRKGTSLQKDAIKNLGATDTGDPKVLQEFVESTIKAYPAKHYALVLWNHGAGWDDENIYEEARKMRYTIARRGVPTAKGKRGVIALGDLRSATTRRFRRAFFNVPVQRAVQDKAILFDDNAKDFLDNIEMKRVLLAVKNTIGHKIDLLGMDACLMSMAEVLFQVRQSVGVVVGSEETEPGDGWPYDTLLKELAAKPTMSAQELGAVIVDKYLKSYPASAGVTQAATDLAHLDDLATPVNALATTLLQHLGNANGKLDIMQARAAAQSYDTPDYIDLHHFCDLLAGCTSDHAVSAACQAVMAAIKNPAVVLNSGYRGTRVEHSNGVSIYFPLTKISKLYATLDFAKKSKWDNFLSAYLTAARNPTGTRTMSAGR